MLHARTFWKALTIFSFMLFFVLVRIGASEHALQYGSGPHKHDGKICALSLVISDDDDEHAVLPTSPSDAALVERYHVAFSYTTFTLNVTHLPRLGRASARSPPTL